MKKLIERIGLETFWGGIFAVVTAVAIVIEMALAGFEPSAIAGGVKDFFGTLVTIVMLFIAIKEFRPKKEKLTFDEKLETALINWQQENSNMVVRKPENDKNGSYFSLDTKTDVSDFYSSSGKTKNTGLFLRMPPLKEECYHNGNILVTFFLNKGTFFSDVVESDLTGDHYRNLAKRFADLFNAKHGGFATAEVSKDKEITVTIPNAVTTDEDIEALIDAINTMYTSYLVSARIKVK